MHCFVPGSAIGMGPAVPLHTAERSPVEPEELVELEELVAPEELEELVPPEELDALAPLLDALDAAVLPELELAAAPLDVLDACALHASPSQVDKASTP